MLVATASATIKSTLAKNRGWDLLKDFAPVLNLILNQNLLAVHPSVPATNVRELIALAKARPGQITYASYGNGSSAHLIAELFKMMAGVDLVHVPYKGAAPAVNDVLAGQVNLIFADVAAIMPHLKAGKLRPLGVGSAKRFDGLPEVPTIAEAGAPGFAGRRFLSQVAPASPPPAAIDTAHAPTAKMFRLPTGPHHLHVPAGIPDCGVPE